MHAHEYRKARPDATVETCAYCPRFRLIGEPIAAVPAQIESPFDSDDFPKSVLIQDGDDRADTHCDDCGRHGDDFPRSSSTPIGVPAAMFKAAIYCADCLPFSYSESGERVSTLTGDRSSIRALTAEVIALRARRSTYRPGSAE